MNSFVVESYDAYLSLRKEMVSFYPFLSKTGSSIEGQSVEGMPL